MDTPDSTPSTSDVELFMFEPAREEEEKRCVFCEKSLGVLGLVIGVAFILISVDVLTNGFISSMISGREGHDGS